MCPFYGTVNKIYYKHTNINKVVALKEQYYITEIKKLLPQSDESLLEYVLLILQKSITSSEEHQQYA